ncbi:hypothetical protein FGG08_001202 [Glutinoglossum americanum]|uniref:Gpi anchored protein n=1 Tax=Glutinoglossum americanum TaxID=1670608 RepID=A0A9P8I8S0_9PEZI|nr:hypothetical protein FGG08_001202 [Glutinoglossum americanum]
MRKPRFFAPALLPLLSIALNAPDALSAETDQFANRWPYDLPVDAKFWPEDEPFHRRDLAGFGAQPQTQTQSRTPVGVKKMSGDEGEKFYLGYWVFDGMGDEEPSVQSPLENTRILRPRGEDDEELYASASIPHNPPFLLHAPHHNEENQSPLHHPRSPASAALLALQNRAFKCPGGTADCSSIGRPNTCCANGEVCQIIPNTGLGDVGCCPVGKGCSGDLKNCDLGFTKCSDDLGGGCCIPDYVCVSIGSPSSPAPHPSSAVAVAPTASAAPQIAPPAPAPPPRPPPPSAPPSGPPPAESNPPSPA